MAILSQALEAMRTTAVTHACSQCKVEQPYGEFYFRTPGHGWRGQDGQVYSSICRTCTRARTAKWRETGNTRAWKDVQNQKGRAKRQRIRDAVFGAYGGYRCVCCGETERLFLTLDHIANDGAKFRRDAFGARTYAGYRTYAWLHRHGYPAGVQVLCMNCQFGKRMNHGICPHQQQGRRNDYPGMGVGSSDPKRIAPSQLRLIG